MSYNFEKRNANPLRDSTASNRIRLGTGSTSFDSSLSPHDNDSFYKTLTGSKMSTNDDSDDDFNPQPNISDSSVPRILKDTRKEQVPISFPSSSSRSTGSSKDLDDFRTESPTGSQAYNHNFMARSSDSQTKLILPSSVGFGHGVALNPANLYTVNSVENKPKSPFAKSMREELKKKKAQEKSLPNGFHKEDSKISTIEATPSPYEPKQTFRVSTLELEDKQFGEGGKSTRKTESKHCWRCTKILLGLLFFVGMVAGVCIMIYALRDPAPPSKPPAAQVQETTEAVISSTLTESTNTTMAPTTTTTEIPPDFHCERDLNVLLGNTIQIRCTISDTIDEGDINGITVTVPLYSLDPNESPTYVLLYGQTEENTTELTWSYNYTNVNGTTMLTLLGPVAHCNSGGNYLVTLNGTEHESTTFLVVTSHLSDVDFTLETRDDDQYGINCSVTSGCNSVSLNFLADLNTSTIPLLDVDFTCIINYNKRTGWSVSCHGVMHPDAFDTIQRIVCRPESEAFTQEELIKKEEKLKRPECDLRKHCGYECKSDGDYFVVDDGVCDIFHRCYNKQISSYACANGTYFVPDRCTCDHKQTVDWCVQDGINVQDKQQDVNSCNTNIER